MNTFSPSRRRYGGESKSDEKSTHYSPVSVAPNPRGLDSVDRFTPRRRYGGSLNDDTIAQSSPAPNPGGIESVDRAVMRYLRSGGSVSQLNSSVGRMSVVSNAHAPQPPVYAFLSNLREPSC